MQVVELLGPPGVGKTTLARKVAHRPIGLPRSARAPVGMYRAAYQVLHEQMTERMQKFWPHTGRLLAALEHIAARPGTGRWLLEEGSAQRANVWALIGLPVAIQQAYIEALPVDSLTVCLCTATPEVIALRGATRGRHGLTLEQAPKSLAACVWIAAVMERRGAKMHHFDMHAPVAENAARLAGILHA